MPARGISREEVERVARAFQQEQWQLGRRVGSAAQGMEQLAAAQVQHDQEVKATQCGVQELQAGTSQAFAQVQQHQQVTLDSMEQMRQEMEAAIRHAMELSAQLQALKEKTQSSRK